MKKYKDIIAGAVVFLVAAIYFALTFGIKKIAFIDPIVGSARFPQIVGIIVMLCAVVIILQGIGSLKKSNDESTEKKGLMELADEAEEGEQVADKAAARRGNAKVVLVLLSFALFAFFMDKIGFGPASFLYLWSQMIIMAHERENRKRIIFYGLLSLVISAVIFVLFRYGFGLILPKAMWF